MLLYDVRHVQHHHLMVCMHTCTPSLLSLFSMIVIDRSIHPFDCIDMWPALKVMYHAITPDDLRASSSTSPAIAKEWGTSTDPTSSTSVETIQLSTTDCHMIRLLLESSARALPPSVRRAGMPAIQPPPVLAKLMLPVFHMGYLRRLSRKSPPLT
jgi:hypothetical protein